MKDLPENLPSPHMRQIGCLFIHSFVYLAPLMYDMSAVANLEITGSPHIVCLL